MVEITTYRGWDISFDTEKETFLAYSNSFDQSEKKQSFSSIKKFIDDFIKDNAEFKPFWIEGIPESSWYKTPRKVIGIRKDNRFIIENDKGEKEQLSDYDEKHYMLTLHENAPIHKEILAYKEQRERINNELTKKIKDLESTLKITTLKSVKSQYII